MSTAVTAARGGRMSVWTLTAAPVASAARAEARSDLSSSAVMAEVLRMPSPFLMPLMPTSPMTPALMWYWVTPTSMSLIIISARSSTEASLTNSGCAPST